MYIDCDLPDSTQNTPWVGAPTDQKRVLVYLFRYAVSIAREPQQAVHDSEFGQLSLSP